MTTEAPEGLARARAAARPVLLYAGTCPKCRFVSAFLVALALGTLTRLPLDHEEAQAFHREHPEARGYPALIQGPIGAERMTWGLGLLAAVPRLLLGAWWSKLRALCFSPSKNPRRGLL